MYLHAYGLDDLRCIDVTLFVQQFKTYVQKATQARAVRLSQVQLCTATRFR